jgi:putative PIN family toxin of toxin-antitoxin system
MKLIVSDQIVNEYEAVFFRLLDHDPALVTRLIDTVRAYREFVPALKLSHPICRDPDDDKIIAAGLAGRADYLVSGDKDLLVLGKVHEMKIVTPRTFMTTLG